MGHNRADLERYLTRVLSQRGPRQLLFPEDVKYHIRQHLTDLCEEVPSLSVRDEAFTYDDGRSVHALKVQGTIPMYYQGSKYNIPVAIWLAEAYPRKPPIAYVEPTPDMIIKPGHPFVSASGRVDVPYLREWNYPRSSLVDLSQILGVHFGDDPPLFAKPPGYTPPPPQPQPPPPPPAFNNPMVRPSSANANPYGNPYGQPPPPPQQQQQPGPTYGNPIAFHNPYGPSPPQSQQQSPAQPPPPPPKPQGTPPPPPPPQGPRVDPAELAFRRAAVTQLAERLKAGIAASNTAVTDQLKQLGDVAKELDSRHAKLTNGLQAMEAERTALERNVGIMSAKTAELDSWLKKHEEKAESLGGQLSATELEEAIVPVDKLSAQALEAAAEDMAIEDTLYSLERGLQSGIVDPDHYLKQVRKICRKQFFARAMGVRVAEMQQRQQEAQESRRGQPADSNVARGLSLPQGDSWVHTSGHFQRGPTPLAPQGGGFSNPLVPGQG